MDGSSKAKLKISPRAAAFLRKEVTLEEKTRAARGEIPLEPSDLISLLLYLSRDPDREMRKVSLDCLKELNEDILIKVCTTSDTHPVILDVIAQLHNTKPVVTEQIALHPNTAKNTLAFLSEKGVEKAGQRLAATSKIEIKGLDRGKDDKNQKNTDTSEPDNEKEENEEHKSKFQMSQELSIKDKIKLALTGDKEWRMLLIKDNNKLVSEAVIKNPRITEQEILLICKSTVKNDEIIRSICTNKDWTKNGQIRKALIENSKTPLHYALSYLSYLGEKDLSLLSKSRNISSVIVTQARRMLFNKKQGK